MLRRHGVEQVSTHTSPLVQVHKLKSESQPEVQKKSKASKMKRSRRKNACKDSILGPHFLTVLQIITKVQNSPKPEQIPTQAKARK